MRFSLIILSAVLLFSSACRESRIHDHPEWGKYFEQHGIKKGCIMIIDNNHEAVNFYNKERCLQRFAPASTFKIMNSLIALETAVAPDDALVIPWDSIDRGMPEWNKAMNMREAFKVSNVPYYQEIARRIGAQNMAHYLDTCNYGNKNINGKIDEFWLNDTLKISADEQAGFVKRMYFAELPLSERSQRIVKSMMLQEQDTAYRLYYKTGWDNKIKTPIMWIVGFAEKIEHMKEHENSTNKSNERNYPYFFALNFEPPADTTKDYKHLRVDILKDILKDFHILPATVK
jgi:beta-lactamase class D